MPNFDPCLGFDIAFAPRAFLYFRDWLRANRSIANHYIARPKANWALPRGYRIGNMGYSIDSNFISSTSCLATNKKNDPYSPFAQSNAYHTKTLTLMKFV